MLVVLRAVRVAKICSHTFRPRCAEPLQREVLLEAIPAYDVVGILNGRRATQPRLGVVAVRWEGGQHDVVQDGGHRRKLHPTALRLDEARLTPGACCSVNE
eukprot:4221896-Prymnesium_polylepis.1